MMAFTISGVFDPGVTPCQGLRVKGDMAGNGGLE